MEQKPSSQYATLDVYNPFDSQGERRDMQQPPPPYQPPTNMPQPPTETVQPPRKPSANEPKNYGSYGSQEATAAATADLLRKQEELNRKAAELDRRERELQSATLGNAAVRQNNWPPLPSFCPIQPCFYQDISVEIPQEFQKTVFTMYYLWTFSAATLFLNFLASLAWFCVDSSMGSSFGLSILWALLFTPCSFVCWYRPLYKAVRSDSSFNFFVFFFIFFVQDIIYVLQTIGIPGWGFSGWIASLAAIKKNLAVAIIMMIVALFFTATSVLGIVMLKRLALSGLVGIVSWRRPFTLVITFFTLLSALSVMLNLVGSILSCQTAQLVKSYETCQRLQSYSQSKRFYTNSYLQERDWCFCCKTLLEQPLPSSCSNKDETLMMYPNPDCRGIRTILKDLLFSVCGLTILSTIICILSAVICCIHIFSQDVIHVLIPQRSTSVNLECLSPQDVFLQNLVESEEFVPPVPPPPYYPPEYTCSSETDAQSITYNGSMDSPVPLYPTDYPPSYETVMGLRGDSQATLFDPHVNEMPHTGARNRINSAALSVEASMDSGSLVMSEIIDMPNDSSPSEDSCLLELQGSMKSVDYVLFRSIQRSRADYCLSVDCVQCGHHLQSPTLGLQGPFEECPRPRVRSERSYSCSTPSACCENLPETGGAMTHSCNRLEAIGRSLGPCLPEVRVKGKIAILGQGTVSSSHQASERSQRRCSESSHLQTPSRGRSLQPLARSHSDPAISLSNGTDEFRDPLYSKVLRNEVSTSSGDPVLCSEVCLLRGSQCDSPQLFRAMSFGRNKFQVTKRVVQRLSRSGTRSLGDLKVCRNTRVLVARILQRSKRNLTLGLEQAGNQKQVPGGPWQIGHLPTREGIHLRSCGDLSSTSPLRRLLSGRRLERTRPHSLSLVYKENVL
nr:protein FAM189B isoform X2 [Geotrypetes seraphini]